MVNCRAQNGKIILSNSILIPDDVAKQIEATLRANSKRVNALSKDLNLDVWVETQNGRSATVAERKFSNESETDVIEEIKSLRTTHHRFIEAIMSMECKKEQVSQPEENTDVPDKEAEEFLNYALVCKLQELLNSCSAIIIAIPK